MPAQQTTQLADKRIILNINLTNKIDSQTNYITSTKITIVFSYKVEKEEYYILLKILVIYLKRFIKIFIEKKRLTALLEYKPQDYIIPLQKEKELGFQLIYQLLEKELKEVKRFINEIIKKGYIRPSTSPAGFLIFFILKKDRLLQICVNFR